MSMTDQPYCPACARGDCPVHRNGPEPPEATPAPELDTPVPMPIAEPGLPKRAPSDHPKAEPIVRVPRHQLEQIESHLRQHGLRLAALEVRMAAFDTQASVLASMRDDVVHLKDDQVQLRELVAEVRKLTEDVHALVAGLAGRVPFVHQQ